MFHLFDTIGSYIRSAFAVGFAAFWGWSSVLLNGAKITDLHLMGMVGTVVMIGLAGAAIFAGFFALILFLRDGKKPEPEAKKPVVAEPQSTFDPDAIIARHMARFQTIQSQAICQRQSVRAPRFQPALHRPLGAANSFGRKLA